MNFKLGSLGKIKAVCLVDSTRSLLLYALIYGKEQFESTFFFVSDAISADVCHKLIYSKRLSRIKFNAKNFLGRFLSRYFLYHCAYFRWPFLKYIPIYGADHLWFSSLLIKKRKITVIEDGLANYSESTIKQTIISKHSFFYRISFGPLLCKGAYGYSDQVTHVMLTGITTIPECIKNKAVIVDILDLWKAFDGKRFLLNLFGVTNSDLSILQKKRVLILTQPFNVDIGDEELIKIYHSVVRKYRKEDILIKTHPRDTINFETYFPGITVYSKKIPVELFALLGINFTDIYTICSTAIFSFPDTIQKHFLGTVCHPLLLEKYGKITMENFAK